MRSNQTAKDNAIQVQADTINVGLTEKEVREMMLDEGKRILAESKLIASDIALKRINDYIDILIPRLVKSEVIQAFSEPSIQVLLNKTERTAICTSRETDYEMLSELLINRVKKDNDYVIKAATNKAVEIIGDISEEALLGITLLFAVQKLVPEAGISNVGLEVLNSLYGKLIRFDNLPSGQYWIDNLELVQAVRIIPFSALSKFNEIIFEKLDGYFMDGINNNSEQYKELVKRINAVNLPTNILIKNPYLENYSLVAVSSEKNIDKIKVSRMLPNQTVIDLNLNDRQISLLKEIYNSYEKNSNNINIIKNKYNEQLKKYTNLEKVSLWWDNNISNKLNIQLTTVGTILAQVNAKRLDDRVPSLNK